jgi:hypothetical protein
MAKVNDGGPAFPTNRDQWVSGMTLLDYFAAHAPEPTKEEVAMEATNDNTRLPQRTYARIIGDLKYKRAIGMMEAREYLGLL